MVASTRECPRRTCHAPETGCILGHDPTACRHFAGRTKHETPTPDGPRIPWSGLALGRDDLPPIAALGRVRLVALVGLHNAGKTTALAAAIIARRRDDHTNGTFAGSYTLLGWQQIARHLEWPPQGTGGFPPHTSSAELRLPSLLHIALCANEDSLDHVLYTDVPGEWFRQWALDADAMEATTWLSRQASSFVVFSDSDALAGEQRGQAFGEYETLARRLASEANGRPVIPVRAKADVEVREAIMKRLDGLNEELFGMTAIPMSIRHGVSITQAVDRGTEAALASTGAARQDWPRESDPLLSFRSPFAP